MHSVHSSLQEYILNYAIYCPWFQFCSMVCFYADNAKLSAFRTSRCNHNLWKLFTTSSENEVRLIRELCSFFYFNVFQLMSTASVALQRRHTTVCDHIRTVRVVIIHPWMLTKIHKFTTLSAGDVQTAQSWAALLHTHPFLPQFGGHLINVAARCRAIFCSLQIRLSFSCRSDSRSVDWECN